MTAKTIKMYRDRVEEWYDANKATLEAKNWLFTPHARETVASALMAKDKINLFPGHFVSAIVSNDLRMTYGRADAENRECLSALLMCYWNVETYDLRRIHFDSLKESTI